MTSLINKPLVPPAYLGMSQATGERKADGTVGQQFYFLAHGGVVAGLAPPLEGAVAPPADCTPSADL